MALPWVDFVWTIKRWLGLYPLEPVKALPYSQPASGNYTITEDDYSLVSTNTAGVTWTLPSPADLPNQVYKIKVRGSGNVTLSNDYIFTDQIVTSLILVTGDMVTLRSDGAYWNVGD